MPKVLLDAAGRRRSPATMPGFHAGRPPRNKGRRYPADPPTVAEIVAVMRQAGDGDHGRRLRGLIVVLWRAGLRIHEALALSEADLDRRRGSVLVRRGKGGRRRQVGMDDWGWEHIEPWLKLRAELPIGPLFCVLSGPTCGRAWSASAARAQPRATAATADVRRRMVRLGVMPPPRPPIERFDVVVRRALPLPRESRSRRGPLTGLSRYSPSSKAALCSPGGTAPVASRRATAPGVGLTRAVRPHHRRHRRRPD